MQEEAKILYGAISKIIAKEKEKRNITYTNLCYENDIPMSTYDDIVNVKVKASFFNIAKIIKGLGLSFEEFGRLLDKELPEEFLNLD